MRSILLASACLVFVSSAYATETGYYNLSFVPDNPMANPFTICFEVINDGAEKPLLEVGGFQAATTGPYGQPAGAYDIAAPKSLAIYMATSGFNATPQYQYFLTGLVDKDNIVYTHNARYMIALAAEPPPPQRGEAKPGSRPGGYTIVDTGSFTFSFVGVQSCS